MEFQEKLINAHVSKVIEALDTADLDAAGKAAVCRVAAQIYSEAVTAMTLRANIANLLGPKR